jgi:hypothetical protein
MVGDEAVVRERERWRSRLRADVVERVGGRVRRGRRASLEDGLESSVNFVVRQRKTTNWTQAILEQDDGERACEDRHQTG